MVDMLKFEQFLKIETAFSVMSAYYPLNITAEERIPQEPDCHLWQFDCNYEHFSPLN